MVTYFNKIPKNHSFKKFSNVFIGHVFFARYVLYLDRIFAIGALFASIHTIFEHRKKQIIWRNLIIALCIANFVNLLSEFVPSNGLYLVLHSLWHFMIFGLAEVIAEGEDRRYWKNRGLVGKLA